MRLIDAFRSLPEQEVMRKPDSDVRWAVVYDFGDGRQWVGCPWKSREHARYVADGSPFTPRFILKVTPK